VGRILSALTPGVTGRDEKASLQFSIRPVPRWVFGFREEGQLGGEQQKAFSE
jgi:hypothetical protein